VLDRDEDNYWPLNGEEPPAELARWDRGKPTAATAGFTSARMHTSSAMHELSTASATIPVQKGFVSVASRYDELMEQAQLRKIDKRAVDHPQPQEADASSSRKRQVEGRGTIASFFSKRQRQPAVDEEASSASRNVQPVTRMPPQVQQDVSNTAEREKPGGVTTASHTLTSTHKPRSTPMGNRPGRSKPQERENQHRYILLSSSPTKPETAMSSGGQENVEPDAPGKEQPSTKAFSAFKPSSTLHTTSMDPSAPQRRTLGVRRSLQGWNARRT
jgi:DNA helicase-2/ATP-dependent DNA helicase PcrA